MPVATETQKRHSRVAPDGVTDAARRGSLIDGIDEPLGHDPIPRSEPDRMPLLIRTRVRPGPRSLGIHRGCQVDVSYLQAGPRKGALRI